VKRLVKMLKDLIAAAETEDIKLAPFIGISCPGVITRTAESRRARRICRQLGEQQIQPAGEFGRGDPQIGGHDTRS